MFSFWFLNDRNAIFQIYRNFMQVLFHLDIWTELQESDNSILFSPPFHLSRDGWVHYADKLEHIWRLLERIFGLLQFLWNCNDIA